MPNREIFFNSKNYLKAFYSNLKISFKDIDNDKIKNIIEISKKLNKIYNNDNYPLTKGEKYIKILELIYTNFKANKNSRSPFRTDSESEKMLLYMFSIDPNFQAAIIAGSCNTIKEIKYKMELHFGLYDSNLIKIENYYIKHFLAKEKQEEIKNEIEKRVYK